MKSTKTMTLLEIKDLSTHYYTPHGVVKAVDGINLEIREGETMGLVGESGCGKSTVGKSILRLISPPGRICDGQIIFKGKDLLQMSSDELRSIRGRSISMIFQEPRQSFDPVYTIGSQIDEAISLHSKPKSVHDRTIKLLEIVGIPSPQESSKSYPFEFSEGMCQRAMAAMALSCNPDLLIADEPTTNLDVTIQAQFLQLLKRLIRQFQMSVLFITHNFGIVREICDRAAVMYAGKIVEVAPIDELFQHPKHPYTSALMRCAQLIENSNGQLISIRGKVPELSNLSKGCIFHPRCDFAMDICKRSSPSLSRIKSSSGEHRVKCFLYSDYRYER